MITACPYCKSENSASTPDENYLRCKSCGIVFRKAREAKDLLQQRSDERLKKYDPSPSPPPMLHLKYAQERDLLVSSGCVVAGRRALDVGTGDGDFLAFLKHLGFDAHGIEPFAPRAHAARSVGLSVIEGRFDEQTMAKFGDVRFDLICFRESIYYVDDLHQMMALCAKYLRARGMLYIKTLVADSTYFRLVGTISKRAGDACTIMFTRAALTKFLKDFGYRILAQDQIPYSARALLEYYNVPGPLRRIVAPMVEKFVMPRLTPDHVMVVAEWDT